MAHLRGPDGCPWDRAQDYDSVKGLLLEEAYEVVDAVSARDFDALEDELGDLLFQVVFYSRLAEEDRRFTIDDVVARVHAKLVRRELSGQPRGEPGVREAKGRIEEEVGDLLFAAANLARFLGSDPESCLRSANQKFKRRFQTLEREVAKLGKRVHECGPEELDRVW